MFLLLLTALAGLIFPTTATTASLVDTPVVTVHDTATSTQVIAIVPKLEPTPRVLAPRILPEIATTSAAPVVPFYSQFTDITSQKWQKVGCGITDLTMLIRYYRPDTTVTVNQMLTKGIAIGAYDESAGWTYQGLIDLSHEYGLDGTWYTLPSDPQAALTRFKTILSDGPVILSVHYKFDPKSTIPHLVVVNAIKGNTVYVNDPATTKGTQQIALNDFLAGWKRRVIVIRPTNQTPVIALSSL